MSESVPREPEPDPLDAEPARAEPSGDGGALASLGARGLGAALRPLAGLATMADDIREMTAHVQRMAGNTDVLPDVTETLHAIRARTDHMDKEVTEMHAAVEELRVMLEPIAGQLESVSRITDRLPGGRRRRRAATEAADAVEAAADEADQVHDAE